MEINGWVVASVVGVIVIIAGAIWREKTQPRQQTNADLLHELERLQGELKTTKDDLARMQATVNSLLRSLNERDAVIANLTAEVNELKRNQSITRPEPQPAKRQPILHVVADPAVNSDLDLAKLRQVRERTGMEFTRVCNPTKEKLARQITAAASRGDPWRRIHISAHCNRNGILIGQDLITAGWLSEFITSADIVVLASCEGDAVGNYLGVARAVVVLIEEVTDDQAARFSGAFWMAIGSGKPPQDAFDDACDRSPDVAEFAEIYLN
ncbi:MAG: hypothetical protein KDH89_09545 [Anaerolineae bacterium]|nr:hypothetical protein [Anaerolineae bacterium]